MRDKQQKYYTNKKLFIALHPYINLSKLTTMKPFGNTYLSTYLPSCSAQHRLIQLECRYFFKTNKSSLNRIQMVTWQFNN